MGLACFCLPLACYCVSLTAYLLLLLPLTRLLTTSAYPLACSCLPFTHAACRCCPCYCTHVCRGQDRLPIGSIADPCRIRDCLHMLARHVNLHALITPAPGSIPRLSQPPLQKRLSVVTLAAYLSTYCSFPVFARSWLAHMLQRAHFGRTFFNLFAGSGPAYHCLAAPHSTRPERASLSLPCCST